MTALPSLWFCAERRVPGAPGLDFETWDTSPAIRCIVPNMKRLAWALVLLLPVAAAQSFSVSFPKEVSAQPLDGRLLLILSTDPSDEPRNQIDDSPRSQIVFGLTVDGWHPGEPAAVDATAWGYPVRSLKTVPPGDYTVQAVLNKYETFHRSDGKTVKLHMDQGEGQHWNISPGNLYSKPQKITISADGEPFTLSLTEVIPPIPAPADTKALCINKCFIVAIWCSSSLRGRHGVQAGRRRVEHRRFSHPWDICFGLIRHAP